MKGNYILLIELPQPREISTGKLGLLAFPKGFYAYGREKEENVIGF